jgi:FlaA1/EpsC-like NDP-sugar epimerase
VARAGAGQVATGQAGGFALFDIDRELKEEFPDQEIVPLVADVSDVARMRSIFAAHRPAVVVHAAAHKHVPLMESNATEAVKNNILATRLLGELAGEHQVGAFIQISTDKAVRPTSVMGASKRVAELIIQDLNGTYPTRYISVRFGNVLGSAGSVVPIFREQILNGGPVTVTHPDMVRYFMTIPEAAQLVLQAGAMGEGGEIFVLDMGEPVRILDMARDMIGLFGLRPYEDIDIVFTGIRREKLFERLGSGRGSRTDTPRSSSQDRDLPAAAGLRGFVAPGAFLDGHEKRARYFNEFLPEAKVAEEEQGESSDWDSGDREGNGNGVAA